MSKWTDDIEGLKKEEFDAHIKAGTFRLAFVGMSNAGKSYRSRVLQNECNFLWYQVDTAIQEELGFNEMLEISGWIGFPGSKGFEEREQKYLEAEARSTVLGHLDTEGKNLVFDTTGSVIYLGKDVHTWLRHECLVVNIDISEDATLRMTEKFFADPKPVIWNGLYARKEGESEEEALRQSYPGLLDHRLGKYRELAHFSIPFEEFYDQTGRNTLDIVRERLK
jgi:shikimate kinase